MKKEVSVQGKNGTFKGEIVIQMGVSKITKTIHNRGTHDDIKRTFDQHKVVGLYEGKEVVSSELIDYESAIPAEAKLVEKALVNYLTTQANTKYTSPVDELKKLGFK